MKPFTRWNTIVCAPRTATVSPLAYRSRAPLTDHLPSTPFVLTVTRPSVPSVADWLVRPNVSPEPETWKRRLPLFVTVSRYAALPSVATTFETTFASASASPLSIVRAIGDSAVPPVVESRYFVPATAARVKW